MNILKRHTLLEAVLILWYYTVYDWIWRLHTWFVWSEDTNACCQSKSQKDKEQHLCHTSLSNDQQGTTTFTISKVYTHLLTTCIHLNKTEFQNSPTSCIPFSLFISKRWYPPPPQFLVLELKTNLIVWIKKLLHATCFQGNIWPYTYPPPGDLISFHSITTRQVLYFFQTDWVTEYEHTFLPKLY